MPSDALHPLQRDRKILLEVFGQLQHLIDFYDNAEWDATHLLAEQQRIHLRLIRKQSQIEQHDLD